eukprot:CAMPEP_0116123444 /NCGR_PEP_ID=MMETSP0329-20121206/4755_1 /TAXON_ID=697910 /ORGANISM="Pseudo-nitzschia arenysensis, Strain B593" /LENGTH=846 /DNA_ID=CAMNT_0003617367 /DNA_START=171 /DNA_END=2711 /DNA_ORIENTATION=-
MASAVVASTSATAPPPSAAVARSNEADLQRQDPIASSVGVDNNNNSEGDKVDHRRDVAMEKSQSQTELQQQQQTAQPRMQPLSGEIRSEKAIHVRNEIQGSMNSTNDTNKAFGEGPLPRELRRIIMEVAKNGKCSWLSWNIESTSNNEGVLKSERKIPSSASPPQYSASFANKGVVRKQPSATATATRRGLPPRKRHRNGVIHKGGERMRFGSPDGAFGRNNASTNSRKRPLVLVRTNSSTSTATATTSNVTNIASAAAGLYSSAPSSVGSGRSTGSEPDYDSAPYECDSEGTSATTNSEISLRKTTRTKRSGSAKNTPISGGIYTATVCDGEDETISFDGSTISPYKTLQMALRGALGLVLDHFYQNRGNGYKLSPAERKRNDRLAETLIRSDATMTSDKLSSLLSSEYVFQQRRQRLMAMLLPSSNEHEKQSEEPPFTIQRVAEVLVAPDRYYTQTHKLCNCIEKLLLVNSSTDSFGGSTGGDTSQRRREERELAALADEKGRQEIKLRQRRIAAKNKSPIDELVTNDHLLETFSSRVGPNNEITQEESGTLNNSNSKQKEAVATSNAQPSSTSKEILEALSRSSLRSRFDHSDTQQNVPNPVDVRNITENRRLTNSPPLPGLNVASEAALGGNISVAAHADTNGYVRQQSSEQRQQDQGMVAQVTAPLLFPSGSDSNLETTATNMNILQYHHAVALAGASLNRSNNATPLDNLMTIDASTISQMRSQASAMGAGPGSESTDGRSSASNSDIDSESDDISFDDSASDRSDGSDSGSTSAHHEPFTAARAMVLNRIQQQQRLQNRQQVEGFRPPADSEYQSGDSIDSTRAEDSGGSDSSSSDLAD